MMLSLFAQALAAALPAPGCAPTHDFAFVCQALKPEDLAHIPGTSWLIATGFADGAGLKLVDTRGRGSLERWYVGSAEQIRPDKAAFPACPSAPDAARLNVQGLALREAGPNHWRLYAANHGGREAIEMFEVDATAVKPLLHWIGCAPLPAGLAANSVAATPDGAILVTVLTRPGATIADFMQGRNTGGLYRWGRGAAGFELLPGTDLPGPNGLETSKDGGTAYVVAFGWHAVVEFSLAHPTEGRRISVAPDFMPDNIHWDGDRLLAAGMRLDEPACGGLRKVVNGVADPMLCHRGYVAAAVDPETLAFSTIAYGTPDPVFNGVSTAVVIGRELWLGSYQADRLAHRPLPAAP